MEENQEQNPQKQEETKEKYREEQEKTEIIEDKTEELISKEKTEEKKPQPKPEPKTPREKKSFSEIYNKHYKKLFIITILLLVVSLGYIFYFYNQYGDIMYKDVTLSGGTSITVHDQTTDINNLKQTLIQNFSDLNVRKISELTTGKQLAFVIETSADADETKTALEQYLGYSLNEENSSIEFTGSSLGANFYAQLRLAIILAFALMAIVVFIIFRTFIPSFAVILSAFADITMTLAFVNLLGMRLSTAGIVAFLMLIGYSVDTDILLTTRMIKHKEGALNSRMFGAFKTGITMTLTSLAAVFVAYLIVSRFSPILTQIFFILCIGLLFDLLNTWITNASILKLYCEKKNIE